MIPQAPAPWTLTGTGSILMYRFPKAWALSDGSIPDRLQSSFLGGFGAVMLVDYQSSPVGPYHELLFIPGRFQTSQGPRFSISRIFVSSEASTVNGQANWGIPKETCAFDVEPLEKGGRRITLSRGETFIAKLETAPGRIGLPFSTGVVPAPLRTVMQTDATQRFFTVVGGHGRIRPLTLRSAEVNPAEFPDFAQFSPLVSVHADPFTLRFPIPTINPLR